MNTLIGDSRVRGLREGNLQNLLAEAITVPGAKICVLEEQVLNIMQIHHDDDPYDGKLHVYLSAGICNLTQRIKNSNYQEVIFDLANSESIINETIRQLSDMSSLILQEGAVPILCTTP